MITEVILKSVVAVLSAVIGASVTFMVTLNHRKLCSLISFSAGALLGAAAFTILPESFDNLGTVELILAALTGYLLFYFIGKYFSHVCPACSATHFDEKTTKKFTEIVWTLIVALSIHSFLDGVAITSSGINVHHGESVFVAITTHKFPEGLALAALMFSSNYRRLRIITWVIAVELMTVLGAVSGYYLFESSISPVIISLITAHIAGGFVYLAVHAIAGEMLKNHKMLVLISFSLGLILILCVKLLSG